MRKATSPLVRCNWTTTAREMATAIRRRTGERIWELLDRLLTAELERLEREAQQQDED